MRDNIPWSFDTILEQKMKVEELNDQSCFSGVEAEADKVNANRSVMIRLPHPATYQRAAVLHTMVSSFRCQKEMTSHLIVF